MKTGFWHRIRRKIRQLPEVEPKDMVWDNINAAISFEERLHDVIPQLPEIKPKQTVWENISENIETYDTKTRVLKRERLIVYFSAAAASIAIILISVFYLINNKTHIEITINEEQIIEEREPELKAMTSEKTDPYEFIDQHCKRQQKICNGQDFIEKKELLTELETELKKINKIIEMYGESPALIKSMIKIENMRSETIREVIKMLNV